MHVQLAFPTVTGSRQRRPGGSRAKIISSISIILIITVMTASLSTSLVRADIIYGTSGSNIVSYNTQMQATATIPTNLYPQSYGIAYSPTNGDLYVVDRDASNFATQKIEIYSTAGADLGTFAAGLPYNGLSAGLTFDAAGNLYASISNAGTGAIEEFFKGGGSTLLPGVPSFPNQITVDGSNNLFVTDVATNNVYEYGPARGVPVLFEHQSSGAAGVVADATGHVYISTGGANFSTNQYLAGGGAPTASPYTDAGSYGMVYDPGTNSIFGAGPPNLYQIDPANGNPNTNYSLASGAFPGTVYLTVQVVPEPSTVTLLGFGVVGLLSYVWRSRSRKA